MSLHLVMPRELKSAQFGPDHRYLAGIPARYYDTAGLTVEQKAQALGIGLDRVAKTVYFQSRGGRLYGAVIPFPDRVDEEKLEAAILESLPGAHRHYAWLGLRLADSLPCDMRRGSCGPFPTAADLAKDYRGKPLRGTIGRIVIDVDDIDAIMGYVVPGQRYVDLHTRTSDILSTVRSQPGSDDLFITRASVRAQSPRLAAAGERN